MMHGQQNVKNWRTKKHPGTDIFSEALVGVAAVGTPGVTWPLHKYGTRQLKCALVPLYWNFIGVTVMRVILTSHLGSFVRGGRGGAERGDTSSRVRLPTANCCSKLLCRREEIYGLCEEQYAACNRDGRHLQWGRSTIMLSCPNQLQHTPCFLFTLFRNLE
jgi:hypothetical protein